MMTAIAVESRVVPWLSFALDDAFVDGYRFKRPPFGGNGMGEATFYRTYSRDDNPRLPEGQMETWVDTCRRVIEGMTSIEQDWCAAREIMYNDDKAQRAAQEAFGLLFDMKWMPPGRGLWMMGTAFVHERGVVEALQNCAFVSTLFMDADPAEPFRWLMNMSMMGVGVGFDVGGARHGLKVYSPNPRRVDYITVEDSREGWADSVYEKIQSFLVPGSPSKRFDYTLVRPAGTPIKGFGGVASGPEHLRELHERLDVMLTDHVGRTVDSTLIEDMMNVIGVCVVSGNVRRSAEIALGWPGDIEFLESKDYAKHPERAEWGWMSNNSIFCEVSEDPAYYLPFAQRTHRNGEPGYIWMDNVHRYERMNRIEDLRDILAAGFNPCAEQPLRHKEMCTLTEVFMSRITGLEEARLVMKHSYRYAKIITLANEKITDPESRRVMMENRRIGLSDTGIATVYDRDGEDSLVHWFNSMYAHVDRYDALYSQWYGVPRSVRMTSVKPSGTVALLPLVTPGIHFAVTSRFHIRRVNMPAGSKLAVKLMTSGYPVEPNRQTPETWVVSFPCDMGPDVRSEDEVSPEEQMRLHRIVNRYWAGNNPSQTIKFDPETFSAEDIANLLAKNATGLKAISFLPKSGHGYEQAPYESITEEQYHALLAKIDIFHIEPGEPVIGLHQRDDRYCDGDACEVATYLAGG